MAEKKYYWLKLKKDFFTSIRMKKLRGIAGGPTYMIIYLKLLLMTIDNDGVYQFQAVENSIGEELAVMLDEKPEDVGMTLNFLQSVGLLEQSEEGIVLSEALKMVGSEGASAERMRKCRENKVLASHCDAPVTNCYTEKEKEIEKDKDKDKEKSKKSKFGEFGHVRLTDKEHEKLINDFGTELVDKAIQILDEAIEVKGYKYKNHNLVLRKWPIDEARKELGSGIRRTDGEVKEELGDWVKRAKNTDTDLSKVFR